MIMIAAVSFAKAKQYAAENGIPDYKWRFASEASLVVTGVTELVIMRCAYLHRNYKEIVVASDHGGYPVKWC